MPFTLVEGENVLSVKINSAGKLKFVDVRLKFDEEKLELRFSQRKDGAVASFYNPETKEEETIFISSEELIRMIAKAFE
jgi:hypothetical protein